MRKVLGKLAALVAVGALALGMMGCDKKSSEKTIKIGILYSTTGNFSLSETPMHNAAKMAIDEINAAGGIKGMKIEPLYVDYGSDPSMAAEKAQQMMLKDQVTAIIGTNASNTRLAVIPTIEKYNGLLVYNTYYEGEKPSKNLLYTNTCPNQQVASFMPWMVENLGKKVYIVGSDYEFPRKSIAFAKEYIAAAGGEIVGEDYAPNGETDFSSIVNRIKASGCDVVFSAVAGNSAVPFFKDYSQYGMDPKVTPICGIASHEAAIKSVGASAVGCYASFDYFNSIDTPENKAFIEKYTSLYGSSTTITNLAEGAYHGVYMLAKAIENAKSLSTQDIIAAASGMEFDTPAGRLKMDAENHHCWLNTYIGQVQEDLTYKVVASSDGLVAPIPN
ncbi:MAG: transporter substrate-binding domain-containing protein [Treponema sp.]|nr:transporter substrate-binding domain-containing protein [Treponema sp.]